MNSSVIDSLTQWGPEATRAATISLADADRYCRRLTLGHYENFPVVSWLLPRELRPHFYAIYAYCRWADDLADEIIDSSESLRLLDWWEAQLLACFHRSTNEREQPGTGDPNSAFIHPVFVALERTIKACSLPVKPFQDLLSAFRQDRVVHEYATFDDLRDYCRRSADPVGCLILHVCKLATPENIALSNAICTGLQLANFWQDIKRDDDIGRIYLPREDRDRHGYHDDDLRDKRINDAFRELMRFEVDRARQFLNDGMPLIDRLPRQLKFDIELFARGGLRVLERIEEIEYRVWEQRPRLSRLDFIRIAFKSFKKLLN